MVKLSRSMLINNNKNSKNDQVLISYISQQKYKHIKLIQVYLLHKSLPSSEDEIFEIWIPQFLSDTSTVLILPPEKLKKKVFHFFLRYFFLFSYFLSFFTLYF